MGIEGEIEEGGKETGRNETKDKERRQVEKG